MFTEWLQSIVLGVVQGLTEFIPISSSGHLVLIPYVLGWRRPGLAFDVALHAGTAGAIILYFRTELVGMAAAVLRGGRTPEALLYRRLVMLLAAASVPVAVVGLVLKDAFEAAFDTPAVAAGMLLLTAVILIGGEALRSRRVAAGDGGAGGSVAGTADPDAPRAVGSRVAVGADPTDPLGKDLGRIGLREAVLVGVCQILALLPGVSRSGTTIMAGLAGGMTREAATRFAFLLALPALIGASIVSLPDLGEPGAYSAGATAAGVVAAFVAGYAAIAFLVRLVAHTSLTVFARYLLVAGLLGLLASATLGPPSTV